jgi:hypothetical protein
MSVLRANFHAGVPTSRLATAADTHGGAAGDDSADAERYRLLSIDSAHAPEGCTGENWFIYRIVQGRNGITGFRRGSLECVSADVQSIVTALNGRRQWTKSKATSKSQRRAAAAARRGAAK